MNEICRKDGTKSMVLKDDDDGATTFSEQRVCINGIVIASQHSLWKDNYFEKVEDEVAEYIQGKEARTSTCSTSGSNALLLRSSIAASIWCNTRYIRY